MKLAEVDKTHPLALSLAGEGPLPEYLAALHHADIWTLGQLRRWSGGQLLNAGFNNNLVVAATAWLSGFGAALADVGSGQVLGPDWSDYCAFRDRAQPDRVTIAPPVVYEWIVAELAHPHALMRRLNELSLANWDIFQVSLENWTVIARRPMRQTRDQSPPDPTHPDE